MGEENGGMGILKVQLLSKCSIINDVIPLYSALI